MKRTKSRQWNWKDAVLANARQQIAESKQSGQWWQRNVQFNPDLGLPDKYKSVVEQVFDELKISGYKLDQKQRDLEILLANLWLQTRRPISISLNTHDYTNKKNRYNRVSPFIIQLVHTLKEKKMIEMKRGYKTDTDSRMTRICATKKLLDYCPEFPPWVISNPKELVILRDSEGKLKDYKDTSETHRIRNILKKANHINNNADIRFSNTRISTSLQAIYREKLTWYGRLHTSGYRHLQGLAEEEREEITINGDRVAELDFSTLHPNLLYTVEGIQYSGDPYLMVDEGKEARPFLKNILLALLNSKDMVTAERAANYWLYNHHSERELLKKIGISRARPLIEQFTRAHQPIAHHFCSGKNTGLKTMNKDASIALDVVSYFIQQNKPILPIHDSFIVQHQYRAELKQVMLDAYAQHTGGFRIKIKG